jgi:hypothetical protein
MTMQRRDWLLGTGALGITTLSGCASDTGVVLTSAPGGRVPAKARVLVVGSVTFLAYDARGRETERAVFPASYNNAATRRALANATRVVYNRQYAAGV